jgi:hypothetical protein
VAGAKLGLELPAEVVGQQRAIEGEAIASVAQRKVERGSAGGGELAGSLPSSS